MFVCSQSAIMFVCSETAILSVVCFRMGFSPASGFYMLTLWNRLSAPSSEAGMSVRNELGLKIMGFFMGKILARK